MSLKTYIKGMKLFVVSSIAASGKTTLVDYVTEKFDLYKLKTCTTRPVREEEKGDEYYFVSKTRFNVMAHLNYFIENSTVYDNYYGLLASEVDDNKDKNRIVILDVQGTEKILKLYPEAVTIFIMPPPYGEVRERLLARNTDANDVEARLKEMTMEVLESENYEYHIKYGNLDDMKAEISKIIEREIILD